MVEKIRPHIAIARRLKAGSASKYPKLYLKQCLWKEWNLGAPPGRSNSQ